MQVTKEQVFSFSPCQSDSIQRIDELFGDKATINVDDILAMNMPDDHKLWLILRPELLPVETLDQIKAAFLALIPQDHEQYNIALAQDYWHVQAKVMRALQPQTNEDTAAQLLNIVRGVVV